MIWWRSATNVGLRKTLRNEHYANGDAIPANLAIVNGVHNSGLYGFGEGCELIYRCDACDPTLVANEYGRLYNWYAVDDDAGLCPSGWHVPTDGEFMTLEMELGMSESEANVRLARHRPGTQMKPIGWPGDSSWNGTNSSGFSGLPGGMR